MNPSSNARLSGQVQNSQNKNSSIAPNGINNSGINQLMGNTVFNTVYSSQNQGQQSAIRQSNQANLPSQIVQSNYINSQIPNKSSSRVPNASVQNQNIASTQAQMSQNQRMAQSKRQNGTVMKNGNLLNNIDINDQTQSMLSSQQRQSNLPPNQNNNMLMGNQTIQSIHISKESSKIANSTASNRLNIQNTTNSIMKNSANNQSVHNTANVQSQRMSNRQSNINPNASKNPLQSSFPMPPSNSNIQNQSNKQSIKPVSGSLHTTTNQNPSIRNSANNQPPQNSHLISTNPNQNKISQNQPHMSNIPNNQNQSMHAQSQFIRPNQNPSLMQQSKHSQLQQQQQSQKMNSKINNSINKSMSLRASRNKEPPMVVKSQSGQIVSANSDCNGNKYSTTDQQEVNTQEAKQKVEEEFKKSILIGKSTKEKPENPKLGNGFKFYGQISKPGKNQNRKEKINQDTSLIHITIGGIKGFNLFGVLDGHGPSGHFVSQFCRDYFMRKTTEFANQCKAENINTPEAIYNKLKASNWSFIKEWYKKADLEMSKENKFDYNYSGTTCNLVFQFNKFLVCSSVGDSRGILIYDNGDKKNLGIFELSHDHKPDLPQELQRILESGGVVDKLTDEFGNKVGPNRVFRAGLTYPGLAMSRSLGDFQAKEVGVTTEPEISEFKVSHHSKYMVICSDGIWEFVSNDKVRDLGNTHFEKNDVAGFCSNLMNFAIKTWDKLDTYRDDITIVCVYF